MGTRELGFEPKLFKEGREKKVLVVGGVLRFSQGAVNRSLLLGEQP